MQRFGELRLAAPHGIHGRSDPGRQIEAGRPQVGKGRKRRHGSGEGLWRLAPTGHESLSNNPTMAEPTEK